MTDTRSPSMKMASNVLGVFLVFVGIVWVLQGVGVLPGSFMTGQVRWAIYGEVAFIAGVALLVVNRRKGLRRK